MLAMILEDLAPGARRRTHTAGTTEASLLGLLDVENHRLRVQNDSPKVNEAIEEGEAGNGTPSNRIFVHYRSEVTGSFVRDCSAPRIRAWGIDWNLPSGKDIDWGGFLKKRKAFFTAAAKTIGAVPSSSRIASMRCFPRQQ